MAVNVAEFTRKIAKNSEEGTLMGETAFQQFVGSRVTTILEYFPDFQNELDRVRNWLHHNLVCTLAPLTFSHGDLNAKNVLFSRESYDITSVIDWDGACELDLPLRDLIHFLVSIHRYREGLSYGAVVVLFLNDRPVEQVELLRHSSLELGMAERVVKPLLVVSWLRYVAATSIVSSGYRNENWKRVNILQPALAILDLYTTPENPQGL